MAEKGAPQIRRPGQGAGTLREERKVVTAVFADVIVDESPPRA